MAEEATIERSEMQKLADKLVPIAQKQLEAGMKFKEPRLLQIQKYEDAYIGKGKKTLKGRFNIPLPIISGFVDTLMAKIDDPPRIEFESTKREAERQAKKVSAAWQIDSGNTRGKWAFTDRMVKKLAIFSGRGIYKYFSEASPEYASHLEAVTYYDFVCEPQGGANLEDHLFCGQINIPKSKYQLEAGVKAEFYDGEQVKKLLASSSNSDSKTVEKGVVDRFNKLKALGLNPEMYDYVGESMYSLVEWYMVHEGTRYYMLFEPQRGIWVRFEKLADLFSFDVYPFVSFATHEDKTNFWSKGACDDIFPLHEAMSVIFNQALDNRHRQNYGQRAFDPDIFPDPSQLEFRPDGLVMARTNNGERAISGGIYEFRTPEITGTIDLVNFIDNLAGTKSGITPAAQGSADKDTRVGVYYGDLKQIADRLGLYNKSYSEAYEDLGFRYWQGLYDNMNEKMMIKMIGAEGVVWEELTKDDISDDDAFEIRAVGATAELEYNEVKKKQKQEALTAIIARPNLMGEMSTRWVVGEILRNAGYDEPDVRSAMNKEGEADSDIIAEATEACELIVRGKKPKRNRRATPAFLQKILDFAMSVEVDQKTFEALMGYIEMHREIAVENMARKAQKFMSENPAPASPMQEVPAKALAPTNLPMGTPEGTAQQSAGFTEEMTPNV